MVSHPRVSQILADTGGYRDVDPLILTGGEAASIWEHFNGDKVIVNVGRALMFPEDGDWRSAAMQYRDMLNKLRA